MCEFLWRLSVYLGLCVFLASTTAAEEGNDGTFNTLTYFVIERQARPLQIEQNGVSRGGIVSDIVVRLAQDLDLSLNIVSLPFKRMVLEMKKPENRNWLAYGSPAWQKKNNKSVQSDCLFPEEVIRVSHSLVTRSDQTVHIDSVEGLFDQRLITLHGYNYPVLADYFERGQIQKLDVKNHQSAFKAVAAKRGLGFIGMDVRVAYSFSSGVLSRSDFKLQDLSFLIPSHSIHLSYDCDMDNELQAKLMRRYKALLDNGEVDEVKRRYLNSGV